MTYTTIIAALRSAAQALTTEVNFLNVAGKNSYDRTNALSAAYNQTEVLIGLLYIKQRIDLQRSNASWEVLMVVLDKDDHDSQPDLEQDFSNGFRTNTEEVVGRMSDLASEYLTALNDTRGIELLNIVATPEIKILASTKSGVGLQFTINTKLSC